jgi:hypothetical protein
MNELIQYLKESRYMVRKLLTIAFALFMGLCMMAGCQKDEPQKFKVQGTAPTVPVLKASGGGAKPQPE